MIRKTIKGGDFKSQMVGELVFDQVPEEGSFNPVTSDAVVKAIDKAKDDMQEKIDEVTLDPSAVALGNVHLLDEVTEFPADGCILVDSETNGPGEMSKDTLLQLTSQKAFNSIKEENYFATKQNLEAETSRAIGRENYIESLFSAPTAEAVAAWLDAHPEAVTTVQDNSLTYRKLVAGTLDFVTPEMFGAFGDGVTDDTAAVQAAVNSGKIILGSCSYKIENVVFNNVLWIGGKIVTHGTDPIELQNNCKLQSLEIYNIRSHTISGGHRVIYITGENNNLSKISFTGSIECGLCIAIGNTSKNTFIDSCVFDPIYKIDIHCGGVNTFIDSCVFKDHTADSISNLNTYSNALKICAFDPNPGGDPVNYTNGAVIKVTNCDMGSHGDNPIDCYTGAVDVVIDKNTIRSINTDCIEIKSSASEVALHETHSYRITNNNLTGYGIIVCYNRTPSPYTNNLYNIIFEGNECHNIPKGYGDNIGRTTYCIQWSMENLICSNNIFDCGGNSLMGGVDRDNSYKYVNCYIYNCNSIFSDNSGTLKLNYVFVSCYIYAVRLLTMRTNVKVFIQNCFIKFTDICFVTCREDTLVSIIGSTIENVAETEKYVISFYDGLAKVFLQNSSFKNTPVFFKSGTTAVPKIVSIANFFDASVPSWFTETIPFPT